MYQYFFDLQILEFIYIIFIATLKIFNLHYFCKVLIKIDFICILFLYIKLCIHRVILL